jgi:aspartate dehydrogenase
LFYFVEKRKIVVFGYGKTGQYLTEKITEHPRLEIAFVWNRSRSRFEGSTLPERLWRSEQTPAEALDTYVAAHGTPDLMVEVSHPDLIRENIAGWLHIAPVLVSSLTAFADPETLTRMNSAAEKHPCFLAVGAAWGIQDIVKMNQSGTLEGLKMTMRFHADALRLQSPLKEKLAAYCADKHQINPIVLYEGSVRNLAPLAPNNVNTMTCLALAGSRIGLDRTVAVLEAGKMDTAHEITLEVTGPDGFRVVTQRINPAQKGAVTGAETYRSFWNSLLAALDSRLDNGVHFC